jgi:hypothetical protein
MPHTHCALPPRHVACAATPTRCRKTKLSLLPLKTVTDPLRQVRVRDVDEKLKRVNLSLLPLPAAGDDAATATKGVSALAEADRSVFRSGVVAGVHDYGVFVTLEGVDGLLHISKVDGGGARVTPELLRERFVAGQEVSRAALYSSYVYMCTSSVYIYRTSCMLFEVCCFVPLKYTMATGAPRRLCCASASWRAKT